MKEVIINTDFITLSQFLKITDLIQSGGQAKFYLKENKIFINNIKEDRRGRKLFNNDIIRIENVSEYHIKFNN